MNNVVAICTNPINCALMQGDSSALVTGFTFAFIVVGGYVVCSLIHNRYVMWKIKRKYAKGI